MLTLIYSLLGTCGFVELSWVVYNEIQIQKGHKNLRKIQLIRTGSVDQTHPVTERGNQGNIGSHPIQFF